MKFFQGEHIAVGIIALLIIVIGIPFIAFLFSWRWLVRAPKWKIFKWISNTKLNAFIATYHAPYNNKYRYWTGLLLLVRVILYVTTAAIVSINLKISLFITIIIVGGLSFLGGYRVYKNKLVDIMHRVMDFNLLALASFTLYNFGESNAKKLQHKQLHSMDFDNRNHNCHYCCPCLSHGITDYKVQDQKRAGRGHLSPLIQSSRSRARYSRICEIKR